MIENQNIVCIAYNSWRGNYVKAVVELMSRLALKNKVFYFEYPSTFIDVLRSFRAKEKHPDVKKIFGIRSRTEEITCDNGATVKLITLPPVMPYAFIKNKKTMKGILKLNARLVLPTIKKILRKNKIENDFILLNAFNPFLGLLLLNKLKEKAHIYYSYDSLSRKRFNDCAFDLEKEYISSVDGVIVSSDFLHKEKSTYNQECHVVKNGVFYENFRHYFENHTKKTNKKIGYIGSLDFRFEAEMVAWTARQMPDFTFEFVGRVASQRLYAILKNVPNISFHPPVKPDQVPEIMFNCDAGIIPYTRIKENRNVYPLKINEYLAVGAPVVMTDFADLPEFKEMVSVASAKEDFLRCIKKEIENDTLAKQRFRSDYVANNSWENRAEAFGEAIDNIMINRR